MVGLPRLGRPGNPNDDHCWFPNDWMDVTRAQQLLNFQQHSWSDMLAEIRANAGWKRYPMRLLAPLVRRIVKRQAARDNKSGQYADVWGALSARFGRTALDTAKPS